MTSGSMVPQYTFSQPASYFTAEILTFTYWHNNINTINSARTLSSAAARRHLLTVHCYDVKLELILTGRRDIIFSVVLLAVTVFALYFYIHCV